MFYSYSNMFANVGHVVFLVVVVVVVVVHGQNYCAICQDHTMCKYQNVGPKCSPFVEGGVSESGKSAILNAFNTLRQKVAQGQETRGAPGPQPAAANMRKMVWSPELSTVAQRWAEQCDFKTDKCRAVSQFRHVGQNVYRSSTTGSVEGQDWSSVIDKWYQHVKDFNQTFVSALARNPAGSYTQLVWAETYQVGCGYAVYKESANDEWTHQYYVCNYGPGGNRLGTSVYKKGRGCSQCPSGTTCSDRRYPALCA